jgi:hypothetical protein
MTTSTELVTAECPKTFFMIHAVERITNTVHNTTQSQLKLLDTLLNRLLLLPSTTPDSTTCDMSTFMSLAPLRYEEEVSIALCTRVLRNHFEMYLNGFMSTSAPS